MRLSRGTKAASFAASAAALALIASGCSSDTAAEPGTDAPPAEGESVELTITTFGTFGYEELYEEYEAANPGVTIDANNIDTGGNARTDAFTKLAAGGGLSDIVASKRAGSARSWRSPTSFVDLSEYGIDERAGRLGRLEVRAGHRPRRPRHRLRHRHRPRGHLLQRPALRSGRAAERPRGRRRVARRRLGHLLLGGRAVRRRRPARPGTTTPASSGTPW